MARSSSVTILFNGLPALRGTVRENAGRIVQATALGIETDAKSRAPVDTGTLRRSIHTVKLTDLSATVGPSVDYGAPVEYGVHGRAGQPFMTPAAEAARPTFLAAMKKLLD